MSCGVCRSSCSRINIAPRASFSLVMVENSPPMMKLKNYYLMMVPLLTAANMGGGIAQQTLLDVPSQHVEDGNAFARTSKRIVVYMTWLFRREWINICFMRSMCTFKKFTAWSVLMQRWFLMQRSSWVLHVRWRHSLSLVMAAYRINLCMSKKQQPHWRKITDSWWIGNKKEKCAVSGTRNIIEYNWRGALESDGSNVF